MTADVCVVGGGYTGLWTAIELAEADPALEIVVLEAELCGHGASGRNGGFAMTWWNQFEHLVEQFGEAQALLLARACSDGVGRIERFAVEEETSVGFRRGGLVWASAAPGQDGVGRAALAAVRAAGEGDRLRAISGDEARARVGSPLLRDGIYEPDCASVQPAQLVRALRAAALRRGVRIHERSAMTGLDRDRRVVTTAHGAVHAARVVLATNAWLVGLPELRPVVTAISSMVVLTEPMPERIARLGWTGGEIVSDGRMMVHYTHVTRDGRIAFGRGGGPLGVGGRIPPNVDWQGRLAATVAADFRRFFPQLADARIEAAWGGAVDRSTTHLPFFAPVDDAGDVLACAGYSGNGVTPSVLAGRLLAELALGRQSPLTGSPLVGFPARAFPPEPLRFLGGSLVRGAVARKERREEEGRGVDPLTRRLARLVDLTIPRRGARRAASAGTPAVGAS